MGSFATVTYPVTLVASCVCRKADMKELCLFEVTQYKSKNESETPFSFRKKKSLHSLNWRKHIFFHPAFIFFIPLTKYALTMVMAPSAGQNFLPLGRFSSFWKMRHQTRPDTGNAKVEKPNENQISAVSLLRRSVCGVTRYLGEVCLLLVHTLRSRHPLRTQFFSCVIPCEKFCALFFF